MPGMTLDQVAEKVGGRLLNPERDGSVEIQGVSAIGEGQPGTISFCSAEKYVAAVASTGASAVLVEASLEEAVATRAADKPIVLCSPADYAFSILAEALHADYPPRPAGTHPTAVVDETAIVGNGVYIGPYVVVEANAVIGDGCVLEAFSYVGYKARLGKGCKLYQQVIVREHCVLGNAVILQPGVIIGGDGFGYVPVDGVIKKIPQLGNVILEDAVEIGANTTVDRARFQHTKIGPMTKIDNLVQVAHNVEIGAGTIIAAQSGIAGSTKIGAQVLMGGQVGVVGHVTVGDGARFAARSSVMRDTPGNQDYIGVPAVPGMEGRRVFAMQRRLPETVNRVRALEQRLEALEKKLAEAGE